MSVILGDKTITDIYLGDKAIVNGWVGDKMVFGKTEGVWWERHKWLNNEGSHAIINLSEVCNIITVKFTMNVSVNTMIGLCSNGYSDGIAAQYYNGYDLVHLWINGSLARLMTVSHSSTTVYRKTFTASVVRTLFICYGHDWANSQTYIGEVVGDNSNYFPCQLLRTLPASKAWDGKTHSAGECGMWDTIGDKFYGNANTSGMLSVSDEY